MIGNPGSSKDPNFMSNSNELMEEFNKKTNEILKTMAGLHFSTIDLRNKLTKGCINNNFPIITQVTVGNVSQGQGQVRVEIYLPAQSCWREIRGFLHKEMNLRIKSSFYEVLSKNEIYPPWTITFQPPPTPCAMTFQLPPNLMTNPHQIETIVSLRKNQAKDMLITLSLMSSEEANNLKDRVDASTHALRAYYQQLVASQYNLNKALDALVTLTDRLQKLVHAEQQKKFLELNNKPSLALYTGCPEQFVPDQIKNQRLQPFLPPPGTGVNPDPPRGEENQSSEQETKETQSGLKGPLPKEGQPKSSKNQEDLGTC